MRSRASFGLVALVLALVIAAILTVQALQSTAPAIGAVSPMLNEAPPSNERPDPARDPRDARDAGVTLREMESNTDAHAEDLERALSESE